jgi:integrase
VRVPKYRKHSSRDLAFVEWQGKRLYLPGSHNSAESRDAYRAFLARIMAKAPQDFALPDAHGLTVASLLLAFLDHAAERYGDGTRGEYANCKHALKPLMRSRHGATVATAFGPKALKQWRDSLAAKNKRAYVNQQLSKIKRAFKWAASEELIHITVYQALATVPGLRAGESDAAESKRREGVPWSTVEATIAELSPLVADMVRVQWFTSVRSGSLCRAKPEQFDRSGELWLWRPRHKTEHLGRELIIPVGPRCQAVLLPYMDRPSDAYLFDPRTQRANRRYRKHYATSSYYRAIERAAERAKVAHWFPHQLRHARGQEIRERFGVEGAQSLLGHDTLDATQIYSARRLDLAKVIARETG